MAPDIQLESQLPTQRTPSSQQMMLSGDEPEDRPTAPATPAPPAASSIAPVWLQRLSLFVLVLFCVYLGVLVMVLPWWTRVWDQNLWIQSRPALASILHSGAVRGLISGLGLLDIWIGISEAVHYRDHRG